MKKHKPAARKPKGATKQMTKVKEAIDREKTNEGLLPAWPPPPAREAFAIMGEPDDPDTWKLPHHTKEGLVPSQRRQP